MGLFYFWLTTALVPIRTRKTPCLKLRRVDGQASRIQPVDEASPSSTLRFQRLRMMAQMIVDEAGDEVVAVVVARLDAQRKRVTGRSRGCL